MHSTRVAFCAIFFVGLVAEGCSSTSKPGSTAGSGGAWTNGGAPGYGGTVFPGSGGNVGRGGNAGSIDASASGGASSDAASSGGAAGSGGAWPLGGEISMGGQIGDTGGMSAGGGAPGTGGSGGSAGFGGTATGGWSGSGGTAGTSVSSGTGGVTATGGRGGTGAPSTTGGANGTGGSATGGAIATGGVSSTGGTSATGGVTATGGATTTGGSGGAGGSTSNGTVSLSWDFAADSEGWQGDFCDYPPASGTGYDLVYRWSALPAEVGPGGGLMMSGNNHSDDLFMYVKRRVTGLAQKASYLFDVAVTIDTNASAVCGGIGGAPGESVFVKIGAVPFEPTSSPDSLGMLTLNLDKGNQSAGGVDMKVAGNISNTLPCPSTTYQSKMLSLAGFSASTSADGDLWIILGTDSGFEGITTLYYDRISVTLTPSH
jgi:hypothetical protein